MWAGGDVPFPGISIQRCSRLVKARRYTASRRWPREHSSNLARAGVDDRIIDHFMGRQTEEMRRLYQHLFPEEKRKALSQLGY